MEKDTLITLEDNAKYVLLEELIIDKKTYFYAVKMEDDNENPTKEFEIFECDEEDGATYLTSLENNEFKENILIEFTKKFVDVIKEEEE